MYIRDVINSFFSKPIKNHEKETIELEHSSEKSIEISESHGMTAKNEESIKELLSLSILDKYGDETLNGPIKSLMMKLKSIVAESEILQELEYFEISKETEDKIVNQLKNTPFEDFARYIVCISHKEYEDLEQMVYQDIIKSISTEQDIARQVVLGKRDYDEKDGVDKGKSRIAEYIQYYKSIGLTENYSETSISEDIDRELSKQEIIEGGKVIQNRIELEIGAGYLSRLNFLEMINLLRNSGMITEEQAKSLSRTYKEIGQDGLRREVNMQKELVELMKAQHKETAQIGAKTIGQGYERNIEEHDER